MLCDYCDAEFYSDEAFTVSLHFDLFPKQSFSNPKIVFLRFWKTFPLNCKNYNIFSFFSFFTGTWTEMRGEQGRARTHRKHHHQRRRGRRREIRWPKRVPSVLLSCQCHSRANSISKTKSCRAESVAQEKKGWPASSPRNSSSRKRFGKKHTIFIACWPNSHPEGYCDQEGNQRGLRRNRRLLRGKTRDENLEPIEAFQPYWIRERCDKIDARTASLLLAKEMFE